MEHELEEADTVIGFIYEESLKRSGLAAVTKWGGQPIARQCGSKNTDENVNYGPEPAKGFTCMLVSYCH